MNKFLKHILNIEQRLVESLASQITEANPTTEDLEEKDLIKYNLIRKDPFNAHTLAHEFLIQELFEAFSDKFLQKIKIDFEIYQSEFQPEEISLNIPEEITAKDFLEIIENYHIGFLNQEYVYKNDIFQSTKSKTHLKELGAVYTQDRIAENIVSETLAQAVSAGRNIENLKVLDFGTGTGRFYVAILKVLQEKYELSTQVAIQNTFAIDLDKIAVHILKIKVLANYGVEYLEILNKNILHRNMLIEQNHFTQSENIFVNYPQDFAEVFEQKGFDVIVSNPPYFLLKINQKNKKDVVKNLHYKNLSTKIKQEVQHFRESGNYQYAIEGMLNYYQLSIEKMLQILKPKGSLGIICPSTLFGDVSAKKLRKFLLEKNQLNKVEFFSEKAKLFDNVSQATSIFYAQKNIPTKEVHIKIEEKQFDISYDLIQDIFAKNLEIPQIDEMDWDILKKLNRFEKLKSFKNLRNRRGEFDLLQFKALISKEETSHRLIRGKLINSENIDYEKCEEFVKIEEFVQAKSKEFLEKDFQKERLVCQQVSNMDIPKRLKFVVSQNQDVLSNSCNYIALENQKQLKNLQILLNSYVLNWRFKVTSTNNHINNYELDELPLIDFEKFSDNINGNILKNNVEIAKMYDLNSREITHILNPHFEKEAIQNYL